MKRLTTIERYRKNRELKEKVAQDGFRVVADNLIERLGTELQRIVFEGGKKE